MCCHWRSVTLCSDLMAVECFEKVHLHEVPASVAGELCLTFQERTRSRGRATTDAQQEVCWFLDRGEYLGPGDFLKTGEGDLYRIVAAAEPLSRVTHEDGFLLMRAAYHLGNRHVPLQVTPEALAYQTDHVLDEMVKQLGLSVSHVTATFQPESGAYRGGHHHGSHHHD